MPTSDASLARSAVSLLSSAAPQCALLQPLPVPESGEQVSDVDVVWPEPLTDKSIAPLVEHILEPLQLRLVCLAPYDYDAVALFAVNETATEGIHLDLVHDAEGRGRLGVYFPRLLPHAVPGPSGSRIVHEIDGLLYLARKRHWKGQIGRLAGVRTSMRELAAEIPTRAAQTLTVPAQRDIEGLLRADAELPPFHRTAASHRATAGRLLRRVLTPIGAWCHLEGDDGTLAAELATRFERTLVHANAARIDGSTLSMMRAWQGTISPTRWRPGVTFTFGAVPSPGRPDARVQTAGRDLDDVAADVVRRLALRIAHPLSQA